MLRNVPSERFYNFLELAVVVASLPDRSIDPVFLKADTL